MTPEKMPASHWQFMPIGTRELFASRETRGIITRDHHVFAGLLTPTLRPAHEKGLRTVGVESNPAIPSGAAM